MLPNTFPRKDSVEGAPSATAANCGGVKSTLTGVHTRVSTKGGVHPVNANTKARSYTLMRQTD